MNTIVLIILGFFAFALQYLLSFWQMNKFTRQYHLLRHEGRVAIGRHSGIIRAGVIVLFLIDKNGLIKKGSYIQGVTVFAGYKQINRVFWGKDVGKLTQADCAAAHYSKSLSLAIIDASNNYNILMSGKALPEKKSPLERLLSLLKPKCISKNN